MGAAKLSLSPLKEHNEDTAKKQHAGSTTTSHPTVRVRGGGDKYATGAKTTIRPPKEGTTIGTWNFRSLHTCWSTRPMTG